MIFDGLQCDEVLSKLDPKDGLVKMIDPRLGDNYPLDSVCKVNLSLQHKKFGKFKYQCEEGIYAICIDV